MLFNNKPVYVVDIEADGLLDTATKIHILGLGYENNGVWNIKTTNKYAEIKKVFESDCYIVGHNINEYDKELVKQIIPDVDIKAEFIDTLLLSYILYPKRYEHSVESYAKDFNTSKVKVEADQWAAGDFELMSKRVKKDVELHIKIFEKFYRLLRELYGENDKTIAFFIKTLNFMSTVFILQSKNPFTLDVNNALKNKEALEGLIKERSDLLEPYFPLIPIKSKKKKPTQVYKKNGEYTKKYADWLQFLKDQNLPEDTEGEVEYVSGYKASNPTSIPQQKDLLFSIGWEPCIFTKSISSVTGEESKVPQIKDKDKNLAPSVKKLIKDYPWVAHLEDLSVIEHRLGYVKSFLSSHKNGKIIAPYSKFTVSMRVAHKKPIVNLPSVSAPYGEYVRPLLTCDDGYILCGSDISSLENYIAANLTYKYKPEILEQLNDPDYDSHIEMAVFSGLMTQEDADFFIENKKSEDKDVQNRVYELSKKRKIAKVVNYSSLFGIGAKKLSDDLGIPIREAKKLLKSFWKLNNHVVKFINNDLLEKTTSDKRTWIRNPISGFYLPCSADHKKFNLAVQSLGSLVTQMWIGFIVDAGLQPSLSMHDEVVIIIKDNKEEREKTKKILEESMEKVNNIFNFAARISIDVQFGKTYADIH
jgi:hypothetical protein